MKITPHVEPEDVVIHTLKAKFFELAPKENYPHTPKITLELDNLRVAIQELERMSTEFPV